MYVLSASLQLEVLRQLINSGSISATHRITGVHRDTIGRLMLRFGEACRRFHDREIRDLKIRHIQFDELWTYCGKKKGHITGDEPNLHEIGEFYIFWALCEDTRLIPAFRVGRRNEGTANLFAMDLAERIQIPKPHASDAHDFKPGQYKPVIRISTDGFEAYRNAIDMAFGPYADYACIVKKKKKTNLTISKKVIRGEIDLDTVGTSLVERYNLTARTFMSRLNRRTLCFSKKLANLQAATAIHVTYYNYCWRLRTIKTTPAVQAGLIGVEWKIEDLYEHLRERYPTLFYIESKDEKGAA